MDSAIDAVRMESEGNVVSRALQAAKLKPDILKALTQCGRSIRRGGTLSISGVYVGLIPFFPIGELFDRQLAIRMGQANVKRWVEDILPLLNDDDPLRVHDLTTHRVPLDRAPWAYDAFQEKRDGAIKIVLDPWEGA